jgi:hypothetical protein
MSARRGHPEAALVQLSWLCAASSARRAETLPRVGALARGIGWEALADALARRRLLCLLGPRLVRLAEQDGESRFGLAVGRALEESRRHAAALLTIGGLVRERLADAGIRSSELKGPGASAGLYGDAGRRASRDVDLLVAAAELRRAVDVARALGYEAPRDPVEPDGLPLLHLTLVDPLGRLPPLELHWRIHWYERRFASERLLAPAGAPGSWRPAPADELAALLLYFARDGLMNVRHAADLGAFWDRFGARMPAGALAECVSERPELRAALLVAATVAERVVGIPAQTLIGDEARLGVRERLAVSLARPRVRHSEPQIHAEMALSDGLLTPRGQRLEFARRQLVPPPAVRHEHARRAGTERVQTAAGHCLRSLGRYGLALAMIPLGAAESSFTAPTGRP